jgi:hypothetical protein
MPGTSATGRIVRLAEFLPTLPDNEPLVFVFGAIAHGHIDVDYVSVFWGRQSCAGADVWCCGAQVEESLSFSQYPVSCPRVPSSRRVCSRVLRVCQLSACVAIGRLMCAVESMWDIV